MVDMVADRTDIPKGIIALDIDGTVVSEDRVIPPAVLSALSAYGYQQWRIAFVTGRSFSYGYQVLQACPFAYDYACYNGAVTYGMPDRQVVRCHLLSKNALPVIETACKPAGLRPFIHLSHAQGDICYWEPDKLDPAAREYGLARQAMTREPWVNIADLEKMSEELFAYAKVFGPFGALFEIQQKLLAAGRFAVEAIGDPLHPPNGVLLITDTQATKGQALADMKAAYPGIPTIAAGDDHNDRTLLKEADVAIAMGGAPSELVAVATFQAPPASEQGILVGLSEAMRRLS